MNNQLYRVKPLEWILTGGIFYTHTIVGNFSVCPTSGKVRLSTWTENNARDCHGEEDGKAKAEAWYLERLLPALDLAGEVCTRGECMVHEAASRVKLPDVFSEADK